jgi:predicted phosphate transport protein (TIGR00153 family)
MQQVKECVALVEPMFDCVRKRDFKGLQGLTEQVFKLEHEADRIKNEIRRRIPKSFFLPIYRGDLLAFLKLQDDIADGVEDLAVLLTIKELELPEMIADDVIAHVKQVVQVCDLLFQCTDQLADLVDEDFGGRRAERIFEIADKADHAEWQADKTQYALAQKLFALEDKIRATDIFLWSSVLRELGRLANHADKTGERLRRMLVK